MIEVVFVIVIIGILAAVAIPRYLLTSEDAHVSKLQSFVGTLNKTVGPSLWSGVQRNEPGVNGSLKNAVLAKYNTLTDTGADAQLETIPSELQTHTLDLTQCANAGTPLNVNVGTIASATIGSIAVTYKIGCIDSDLSISPHFFLEDGVNILTR
ncbi:MAG: type II secretion system protein [Campylobacterales bacterium]|nr:type II secretion system protein [Campylobacterales bacterium]